MAVSVCPSVRPSVCPMPLASSDGCQQMAGNSRESETIIK